MINCDDGSTEGTLLILNRYAAEYPDKFIVIRNEKNSKLPYSLNHCLKYVQTDLVARMDGEFMCFAGWDDHLRRKFGDYMQLPPEEERAWRHHPLIIDFEHNYEEIPKG